MYGPDDPRTAAMVQILDQLTGVCIRKTYWTKST